MSSEKVVREKPIPKEKLKIIEDISNSIKKSRTVLLASCKGLPSRQYHDIKKKLRGKFHLKWH